MVTINVCVGSACHLKGSYDVIKELQKQIIQSGVHHTVSVRACFCLDHCGDAVSVRINEEEQVHSVDSLTVGRFFREYVWSRL